MKKCLALMMVFVMLLSLNANAGVMDWLSGLASSREVSREKAQEYAARALEMLKDTWKEEYGSDYYEGHKGYLEIKNTRVLFIRDDVQGTNEKKYFDDVRCIVEFIFLCDYFGSEPYYSVATTKENVLFKKDGSAETVSHYMERYRSISYNSDYSGIIEEIYDLGGEFNGTWNLR